MRDDGGVLPCSGDEFADEHAAPCLPTFSVDAEGFIGAESGCGACHVTHVQQWRSSAHGHAMRDPVFNALIQRQREASGSGNDRFCTQCHSPIGTRSRDIEPGYSFGELDPLTTEGVTCETCHRATSIHRPHSSGLVIDPAAALRGPMLEGEDVSASHEVVITDLLGRSSLCGACHDVIERSGLVLEDPYQQWLGSPAAGDRRSCQSCHMPTYRGRLTPSSEVRDGLHRHDLRGMGPSLIGSEPMSARSLEAYRARFDGVLRLSIEAEVSRDTLGVSVAVKNTVDGHAFPTGSDFNRQCWLELRVLDEEGLVLYESGTLDASGDLFDAFSGQANQDPDLRVLSAYLLDEDGSPTRFSWEAEGVRRNALGPLEEKVMRYRVPLGDVEGMLRVKARVRFRAYAPALLRELGLGVQVQNVPIVDIEEASVDVQVDRGVPRVAAP
ncbi:MAG: multiheme c-type cytochrome [Myxococcales bacterium]|nr:multiheme c-type cytochrome [Myxococcales bacterium]